MTRPATPHFMSPTLSSQQAQRSIPAQTTNSPPSVPDTIAGRKKSNWVASAARKIGLLRRGGHDALLRTGEGLQRAIQTSSEVIHLAKGCQVRGCDMLTIVCEKSTAIEHIQYDSPSSAAGAFRTDKEITSLQPISSSPVAMNSQDRIDANSRNLVDAPDCTRYSTSSSVSLKQEFYQVLTPVQCLLVLSTK